MMSIALFFKLFADGVKITNIHGWDLECSGKLYEVALNRIIVGTALSHVIQLNQCFWNAKWTIFSVNLFAVILIVTLYLFLRKYKRTKLHSMYSVISKIEFQEVNVRDKVNWIYRYSHPYIRFLGTKKATQVMNEINSPVSFEARVHPSLEKQKRFNLPIPATSPDKARFDLGNVLTADDIRPLSPASSIFLCDGNSPKRNPPLSKFKSLTGKPADNDNSNGSSARKHSLNAFFPQDEPPESLASHSSHMSQQQAQQVDSEEIPKSEHTPVEGVEEIVAEKKISSESSNKRDMIQKSGHFKHEKEDIYLGEENEMMVEPFTHLSMPQQRQSKFMGKKLSYIQEVEEDKEDKEYARYQASQGDHNGNYNLESTHIPQKFAQQDSSRLAESQVHLKVQQTSDHLTLVVSPSTAHQYSVARVPSHPVLPRISHEDPLKPCPGPSLADEKTRINACASDGGLMSEKCIMRPRIYEFSYIQPVEPKDQPLDEPDNF